MEVSLDAVGRPTVGAGDLNDFALQANGLLVEQGTTPLNRASLPIEPDLSPNPLKRRQVLSRDKSKRHSATMLEQKHNDSFLEQPEGTAEADNTPTELLHDKSNNVVAKNLQRTGILTSSSQS